MKQDVIAMGVKELRQEIAELVRYYEEYVSLQSASLTQERLQENRIERLEEIKRELANYVKSAAHKPAHNNFRMRADSPE